MGKVAKVISALRERNGSQAGTIAAQLAEIAALKEKLRASESQVNNLNTMITTMTKHGVLDEEDATSVCNAEREIFPTKDAATSTT